MDIKAFGFMKVLISQKKTCHVGGIAVTECIRGQGEGQGGYRRDVKRRRQEKEGGGIVKS